MSDAPNIVRPEHARVDRLVERAVTTPTALDQHADLHVGERGLHFIARFEGFRARPYNDGAGNATIGYGHLLHLGPVTDNDRAHWGSINETRGLDLLHDDAASSAAAVRRLVDVKLNDNEFDALVSFTFNCGAGSLAGSTLLRELNAGHRDKAAAQFHLWVHDSAGNIEPGLVTRREAEAVLFRKPGGQRR